MQANRPQRGIRRNPQPALQDLEDHGRIRTLMQNPFPSSQVIKRSIDTVSRPKYV